MENFYEDYTLHMDVEDYHKKFNSEYRLSDALKNSEYEKNLIDNLIKNSIKEMKKLTPNCDNLDYILSASIGALCSVLDIFFKDKFNDKVDTSFDNLVKKIAGLNGWKGDDKKSAIRFLEKSYKIPYDQRGAGDVASEIFELSPKNHHFKSLGHNFSITGLLYSISDQFNNTSTFVSRGEVVAIKGDLGFELRGDHILSKVFYGFVNWFGHIISDIAGSSSSTGRGMGIPSPFVSWTNDIVVVLSKFNIKPNEFIIKMNEFSKKLYENNKFDLRTQIAQGIPVLMTEILVRFMYMIRRIVAYFTTVENNFNFREMWEKCEPFSNASVGRMLLVGHSAFSMVNVVGAGILSGFNPVKFFMNFNIIGSGTLVLYFSKEVKNQIKKGKIEKDININRSLEEINGLYIKELKKLKEFYGEDELSALKDYLKDNKYEEAFNSSINFAEKRGVENILYNKEDIDSYFLNDKKN